jgi:hypothetical protein
VDFDNDGTLDMISGSYDPGDVYLFRGLGEDKYEAGESIKDSADVPLVHHPVELARYEENKDDPEVDEEKSTLDRIASFGSWPEAVDWDGDGDLDLLIGSFSGEIYLRINDGTRANPSFNPDSLPVNAAGKPINVHGHAHPVVGDWDRDGVWDLVVGSDIGAVSWFRNTGSATAPEFAAGQSLIPAVAEQKFIEQILGPEESPRQGVRAQICVADYDKDGWLDLIVGDYSDIKWTKELSEEELAEKKKDEARMKKLAKKMQALGYEEDVMEQRQALSTKYFALDDEMNKKYFKEARSASFVWLYLRQPADLPDQTREDGSATADQKPTKPAARSATEKNSGPVEFSTRLDRDESDPSKGTLVVEAKIQDGWKLPASAESDQTGIPVSFWVELPKGWEFAGEWKNPVGERDEKKSSERYLKRRAFWKRSIQLPDDVSSSDELTIAIRFQVCNDQLCLPPKSINATASFNRE